MSRPYSFDLTDDGSYNFISDQGHHYLIYFSESQLSDADNNQHIIYNLGFSRDDEHASQPFTIKYDERIRATIMFIVNSFFKLNDHKTLIYFCFGDDGYSRHRNIVFNQWCKDLDTAIEKFNSTITYDETLIYGSLIIAKDNPLKSLIVNSFNTYLDELKDKE